MVRTSLPAFADAVNEMMPVFIREFVRRQPHEALKIKITPVQIVILEYLDRRGLATMTDIAHYMNVSTAAISGIVDRLFKSGYVTRVRDPLDRRLVRIRLVKEGAALVRKSRDGKRKMVIDVFGKISARERESYLRIIRHVREIVSAQHPEEHAHG